MSGNMITANYDSEGKQTFDPAQNPAARNIVTSEVDPVTGGSGKYPLYVGSRKINTKVLRWLSGRPGLLPAPRMMTSPPTASLSSAPTVNALAAGSLSHAWDSGSMEWGVEGLAEYSAGVGISASVSKSDGSKSGAGVNRCRFLTDAPAVEFVTAYSQFADLNIMVDGEVGYSKTPVILPTIAGTRYAKFDFGANTQTFELISATNPAAGGSGYSVGDEITLAGGTGTAAVLTVTQVSSGAVVNCYVKNPGSYSVKPTGTVSQASTTGTGTGFTISALTWGNAHSTRRMRKIEIFSSGGLRLKGINVDTNSTVIPWSIPSHLPRLVVVGDSQTNGTYRKSAFSNMATRIAHRLGLGDSYSINAAGGTGYNTNNGTSLKWSDSRRIADMIALDGDIYLFVGSQNDADNAATQTAVEAALDALLTAKPDALIVGIGSVLCTGSTYTKAAYQAVASRSDQVLYIDNVAAPWLAASGGNRDYYMSSDAQHLDNSGIDYFADIAASKIFEALADIAA